MIVTNHQLKQQEVINKIADQIGSNSVNFTTVSPVDDYTKDLRICFTSVHFPHQELLDQVEQDLIQPLRNSEPNCYYYPKDCLHMTIKNIRVVNNPPHFNKKTVQQVETIFAETIPKHKKFNVYFYRLLLFPNNLALIGTTDEELDNIVLDLDRKLTASCIPDDKVYSNSKYFFSNMTLARFNVAPSETFRKKVVELSTSLIVKPYQVDSITLLTCNAVLKNKQLKGTWKLT